MHPKNKKLIREPKKMVARFDPVQWERAKAIRDKYGFKSIYEMNQLLWSCYLRVADPDGEDEPGSISVEMENVFGEMMKVRLPFKDGKPGGRLPKHVVDELGGQLSLYAELDKQAATAPQSREPPRSVSVVDSEAVVHNEIADTFENLSHAEKHFEYVKPKRAMNNASLNDDKHR